MFISISRAMLRAILVVSLGLGVLGRPADAEEPPLLAFVIVEIEDLRFTPPPGGEDPDFQGYGATMMYALHDGSFRTYREGEAASEGLRHFVNESSINPWLAELQAQDPDALGDILMFPDEALSGQLRGSNGIYNILIPAFDPLKHRYLSYILRICPSDDAFLANEDPRAVEVFDEQGRFKGPIVFDLYSDQIMDAGTRPNDEQDLPCFDRYPRNDLVDSGGRTHEPIHRHPGFNGSVGNPDATPVRILGGENRFLDPFAPPEYPRYKDVRFDAEDADFTRNGRHAIARIRITSGLHGGFSGSYYDPSRSGEGFTVEISGDWPEPTLVMSWYTYRPDGSGEPLFLFGAGPVLFMDGTPELVLYEAEGGQFASTDNPTNVAVRRWGTVAVRFDQPYCERMLLYRFRPDDPSYVLPTHMETVRLSPLLTGFKRYCGGIHLSPLGNVLDF